MRGLNICLGGHTRIGARCAHVGAKVRFVELEVFDVELPQDDWQDLMNDSHSD
jgi:hypothetical protein